MSANQALSAFLLLDPEFVADAPDEAARYATEQLERLRVRMDAPTGQWVLVRERKTGRKREGIRDYEAERARFRAENPDLRRWDDYEDWESDDRPIYKGWRWVFTTLERRYRLEPAASL